MPSKANPMTTTYSPALIARARRIFEERSGRAMVEDETIRYLDALANFGLLAKKICAVERKMQKNRKSKK